MMRTSDDEYKDIDDDSDKDVLLVHSFALEKDALLPIVSTKKNKKGKTVFTIRDADGLCFDYVYCAGRHYAP